MPECNFNDPVSRAEFIERVGPEAYNAAARRHAALSVVDTVNGRTIYPVKSRFGRLFAVSGTGKAYPTLEAARHFARAEP